MRRRGSIRREASVASNYDIVQTVQGVPLVIDPTPLHQQGCGIMEANMQCNRIPDDGFPLLAVAPYQEVGVDRARAELKSRFMAEFASAIIWTDDPKLADKLHVAGLSFPGSRGAGGA